MERCDSLDGMQLPADLAGYTGGLRPSLDPDAYLDVRAANEDTSLRVTKDLTRRHSHRNDLRRRW
jgi:hypothetical protein